MNIAALRFALLSASALATAADTQPASVFPAADWQEASPESQGVDPVRLQAAVSYMDEAFGTDGADQLVIVRNGYLIHKGPACDAYHELYSATKVFTSTLLGLLIGDGRCTLDDLAVSYLPDLDDEYPAYGKIKLRHLASMTGGYRGQQGYVGPGQVWGDPVVYVTTPDAPEFEPAGSQVAYNDHDVHLLGRILATRIAHEPLKDLFQRRIAGPIGMTQWEWGVCGTVDGMPHYNAAGTPTLQGGGGIKTTPLELARLGLLYLNRGNWNGKQLLPADFVEAATAVQVPATMPGRSRDMLSGAYGFYWWTNGVMATGSRRWPSAPARAYTALGASTNFCYVIPEWNMVVVRMGRHGDLTGSYAQQDELHDTFLAKLGEALQAKEGGAQRDMRTDPGTASETRMANETGTEAARLDGFRDQAASGDSGIPCAETVASWNDARAEGPEMAKQRLCQAQEAVADGPSTGAAPDGVRHTCVSIVGSQWHLNGMVTYPGTKAEGLLLNSRMVQGIFDDLNPNTRDLWAYPDTGVWDPERNTREFLAAMPAWREHGLLAFTLNLQGGNPRGYSRAQPWHNSAITEDGDLRPEYMSRLERILNRADELGMAVILGIFYFGQDQRLRDEAAVVRAVDNTLDWLFDRSYQNVLIEINNECDVGYDHPILQPERVHELIERVKTCTRGGRRFLVSTSYGGGTVPRENVVRAADFLLMHGNGVNDPDRIAEMVRQVRQVPGYRPMPILFNEDDHFDFDKPRNNMLAALSEHASWGYFDPGEGNYRDGYQSVPVNWGINTERKKAFFGLLREVTGN